MILAFRYVPGASPEHTNDKEPGDWICVGTFPDEKTLARADDAEYAIFEPTRSTINEGPEAAPQLPISWKFARRVVVKTPAPAPKVSAA